ncbi:TonB-dependent receptor [Mitsuaria sp. GD03876]|uniref:TonB-dependent receptor plug domain-containing protein n=1 Tax=Mitsuaria sp. GD03876 TaxID=2975399 RepID=UPI002448E222|nr:TonB-dependent receptor [Mitsuaria sp. GD03876]MDH0863362.1 TonB-dependent receptor [Mitsuaria sp. GD03876]
MKHTLVWSAWGPLLLALAAPAVAATTPAEEEQLEALLKREVQGPSRYAQSLMDAPAAVSVLGRQESAALGHQTVGDMLSRLPGVYLGNTRSYSNMGLRGFNRPGDYNSRILMAIDGQRVNDAIYDQGLPQLEFPVVAEWVKRVELVQGPGSSIYGSNALLGVVNVVTLDGADAPGLSVLGSVGERGQRRAEMHYGLADAAGGDLFLGVNLQRGAGEDLFVPELGTPDGWVRGLDGERQASVLAKYRLGRWKLSMAAVQRDKEAATAPYGTLPGASGTRYTDRELMVEAAYDEGWQDELRRSVRLALAQYDFRGRYVYGQSPDLIDKDEAYTQWLTLDARVLWRGLLNHELMAGAEVRTSPYGVQRNYRVAPYESRLDANVTQDSAALSVQDQWRLSQAWQLTTGLRLDHARGFAPALSPRTVLVYRPDDRQTLKLMWARSFRAPNLYERYYSDGGQTQLANPSLEPERLSSAELAWEVLLPSGQAVSANVYDTRLNRLIEQVPLGDDPDAVLQFVNRGRVRMRGLDLGIEQRVDGGWLWRASASWMDARDDQGRRLSNAPGWMLKGHAITPEWGPWQLGVEGTALGARLGRVRVPPEVVVNAHLRYRIDTRQSVALHVDNLLDRANLDPSSPDAALSAIPQPRRAWRLDWRLSF